MRINLQSPKMSNVRMLGSKSRFVKSHLGVMAEDGAKAVRDLAHPAGRVRGRYAAEGACGACGFTY